MNESISKNPPATLVKRLFAIAYDLLLLTALLFAVGVLVAGIMTFALNNGNAITEEHSFYLASQLIILSILFFVSYLFFGWFWTHGGQTLGMKTWKVRIQTFDKQPFTWTHALKRFFLALISWGFIGLGFLWKLIDKKRYTWHDHLSKTALFFVENSTSD